uniref:DB domain-containing protein n=1 Tax=Strongyloides stercoralis TaxID=6248 RepID=A0A0K0EN80_STRER
MYNRKNIMFFIFFILFINFFGYTKGDLPSCDRAKCHHCQVEFIRRMCPNTCSSCSQTSVTNMYNHQINSRPFVANGEPNHKTSDISLPLKIEQNLPPQQFNQLPIGTNLPTPLTQQRQNYQPSIPENQQPIMYQQLQSQQYSPPKQATPNTFNLQNPFQLFQFPQIQTQQPQPFNPFQPFLNPAFLSSNNNQQQQLISQHQYLPQQPQSQQQIITPPSGTQNYQGFNMVQPQVYKPLQTQTYSQSSLQQTNISPLSANNNVMPQGHIQKPQPNPVYQQTFSPVHTKLNHGEINNQIPGQFKPRQIYNNQVNSQPSNVMSSINSLDNTNNVPYSSQSTQQISIPKPPEYNVGQQNIQPGYQQYQGPSLQQVSSINNNVQPSQTVLSPQPRQPIKAPTMYPFAEDKNLPYQNGKHQCPKQPNWEPCIDKTLANERFKSCCSPLGEGCSQLCSYDQTLTTIQLAVLTGRCPMSKVGDMMVCASGYEDATPCCEAYGVFEPGFEQCRPYCNPAAGLPNDGMLAEKYKCLGKLSQIQRCFYVTQRP